MYPNYTNPVQGYAPPPVAPPVAPTTTPVQDAVTAAGMANTPAADAQNGDINNMLGSLFSLDENGMPSMGLMSLLGNLPSMGLLGLLMGLGQNNEPAATDTAANGTTTPAATQETT